MNKLRSINIVLAGLLILMGSLGLRDAYVDAQKYGWTYTQTTITIIGDEVSEEDIVDTTVSFVSQAFAALFIGCIGVVLLGNNRVLSQSYIMDFAPLKEGEETGITFPKGKPEFWDLGVDLKTRVIDVTLNDLTISFPLTKILGWVEQHEEKKMEEMK